MILQGENEENLTQAGDEVLQAELPEGVSIVPSSAEATNQQLQNALKTLGALAGIVVFFGMAIATMLTLFIILCFYILLHDLLGWRWAKPR